MSNSKVQTQKVCLETENKGITPYQTNFSLSLDISGNEATGYVSMFTTEVQGAKTVFSVSGEVGEIVNNGTTETTLELKGATNITTGGSIAISGRFTSDFSKGVATFDVNMEGQPAEQYSDLPTVKVACS